MGDLNERVERLEKALRIMVSIVGTWILYKVLDSLAPEEDNGSPGTQTIRGDKEPSNDHS